MEIYLIRHTTPNVAKGICYGQSDISITETFETEVVSILKQLKNVSPIHIFSSPLQRCTILANALEKECINSKLQIDPRLQEVHFGNWELKAWDVIPSEELDPWMEDFVHRAPPGGESFINLQKRVLQFFEELPLHLNKPLFIVSHAGPIRAFLAYISKTPLTEAFSISLDYGQIEKVTYKDGIFTWHKN